MADIVISEFMDRAVIDALLAGRDVFYDPALVDRPAELAERLADSRALIVRNRTRVGAALLAAAPRLVVVGRLGVGLDNIDLAACAARNVAVRPATGANDLAVAEYVVTAALLLLRRAWFASERVAAGQWPRTELMGRELSGKALGLVGFGAIARRTAAMAQGLGMRVSAYDPHLSAGDVGTTGVALVAFETLLESSDVVSLHVPLTAETRRMVGAAAIARMKPGAILINAARGGVVDEAALAEALRRGHLGGAALDVFEEEPLGSEAGAKFAGLSNLVLTPHIAGVTEESNVRVSEVAARAILQALGA